MWKLVFGGDDVVGFKGGGPLDDGRDANDLDENLPKPHSPPSWLGFFVIPYRIKRANKEDYYYYYSSKKRFFAFKLISSSLYHIHGEC